MQYLPLYIVGLLFSLASCNGSEDSQTENTGIDSLYQKAKEQAKLCFSQKQGCNDAIVLFDEVIAADPTHDLAFYNRGVCKMTLTDFKGALDDFSKAIELNPEDFDYYHNKGYVELQLGMIDEACKDFKIGRAKGDKTVDEVIKQACKNSN